MTKAVILAGGRGTRIAEESDVRPKPMIMIGGRPILWHIMQIYAAHGIVDFVICLGYKGHVIKDYFANFSLYSANVVSFDLAAHTTSYEHGWAPPWKVTLVETGENTETGGRIKQIKRWVADDEYFCLTYGDGLASVDVSASIRHHCKYRKAATMTAVNPPGRFGAIELTEGRVTKFVEKPKVDGQVVNGGFFVLSPKVFDFIADDKTVWEQEPLQLLAAAGELTAFQHPGFWQPMDTIRERRLLEELYASGSAPWVTRNTT